LIPFPQSKLFDWVRTNDYFLCEPAEYLNSSSQWDYAPVFATPEMSRQQRIEALRTVRNVRKTVRYNSMKRALAPRFGPLANVVSKMYITDWVQDKLMRSGTLRRNLKRAFMRVTR
jgi:hypothetical protein